VTQQGGQPIHADHRGDRKDRGVDPHEGDRRLVAVVEDQALLIQRDMEAGYLCPWQVQHPPVVASAEQSLISDEGLGPIRRRPTSAILSREPRTDTAVGSLTAA